ncbi:D-alanyl-D-alanine carboxypeptidase [Streptomyces doebereineriae]|uniref:serine-type D-Ala-D-Ala carboxypeptidase n=1 Tax=Streptomyces doebereineriae TaxID=3075528 RepID=A0ABU2VPC9_9ACTN|nr:D-alanyl-D-alanine carboxypeptidase [Streptomyces sp. DSM 41640]MDT0487460.1 D-alanyl-D-alanine carboxypeptidase [Streptomyces sp. DSM 41640]
MEEASVAGESPDRSKQRESSAEPTSGSASPVPEARSSARDPRLAVARESISLGGVDTATRVFSVRDLPETPEKPSEGPTEAGTGGSDTGEPDDAPAAAEERPEDADGPEGPEDADRAEEPEDTARAEGPEDSATAESPGDSGTAEDPDTTDTTDDPDDSSTAENSDDSGTAGNPDDTDMTEEPDDSATAEGSGDSGAPDARLRDAVAAWVRTGDEKTGPEGGSGKAEPAKKPEDEVTEPADDASEDESARDAGPETHSETDSKPEPATDTDAASETDAAETAVADDEDHVPDTGDSDSPGARGTARPAPTDPQTDDETGDDGETSEDGGSGDAGASDKRPVDQPTAVFKAPRPPVDQPTTMLKLGKAAEAAAAEPKDADAPPKPETPAERTSKFVALKALDEPRESRPKPDVTAAVPQVGQVGPERTTQQPLPPKPPLDLLAELTNTPPPPPSPLRTLGRRVKIWTPILILLVVAFAIAQSLRPLPTPTLSLTAEDSYTFDGSKATLPWPTQGQGWLDINGVGTMGNFGKQTPVAIGSVAKAMTAYIVLKDHPLKSGEEGAKITVDALAETEGGYNKQGESTLNTVKQGDVLTERQAIAAIMIPSANNIARLLARWDSGSEAAFIKKMNDTAKELGMKNTKYTDASGLKETTVSSAEDQVKLGNELVKIPALMEITSMGQWIDPSGQKWYNYNYLVPYTGIGIKTGTTTAAGGNLLFAGRKEVGGETVTVVGAILGQHKAPIIKTVNDVSKVALLAAEDALTSTKILKKGDVVGYVDDGLGGHTPVVLTKDVTAVGWAGFKVKLSFAADDVPHTAKAGTKVGSLTVGDGEGGAVKVPVTLQKDLTEPGFTDKLTRVG